MNFSHILALIFTTGLYSAYIWASFDATLSKSSVLPMAAFIFAVSNHVIWIFIARGGEKESAYLYALASDVLLTAVFLFVPVMSSGVRLSGASYGGLFLIGSGYAVIHYFR